MKSRDLNDMRAKTGVSRVWLGFAGSERAPRRSHCEEAEGLIEASTRTLR